MLELKTLEKVRGVRASRALESARELGFERRATVSTLYSFINREVPTGREAKPKVWHSQSIFRRIFARLPPRPLCERGSKRSVPQRARLNCS